MYSNRQMHTIQQRKRDLESRMNIVQYTFMHIFDISRVLCNYRQFGVMPGTET